MFDRLAPAERQYLFRFLCAFAWVDGEVADAERKFVRRLMGTAKLGEAEKMDVETMLLHPPPPTELDPAQVSPEARRFFIEAVRALIFMDGQVVAEEEAQFEALKKALTAE